MEEDKIFREGKSSRSLGCCRNGSHMGQDLGNSSDVREVKVQPGSQESLNDHPLDCEQLYNLPLSVIKCHFL